MTEAQEKAETGEQPPAKAAADGWNVPRPDTIPAPTYVPAAMAFGLTLAFWGLVTSPVVLLVGLAVVGFALYGWIREMAA